jgi:hypothetical protein
MEQPPRPSQATRRAALGIPRWSVWFVLALFPLAVGIAWWVTGQLWPAWFAIPLAVLALSLAWWESDQGSPHRTPVGFSAPSRVVPSAVASEITEPVDDRAQVDQVMAEIAGQELMWVQQDVRGHYELRAANSVIATLGGKLGETAGHRWMFEDEYEGRHRRVIVWQDAVREYLTIFQLRGLEEGRMDLPGGRRLRFRHVAKWGWEWQEVDGTMLVEFTIRLGFDMTEGLVRVGERAVTLAELPLLVVLAEYLFTLFDLDRHIIGIDGMTSS